LNEELGLLRRNGPFQGNSLTQREDLNLNSQTVQFDGRSKKIVQKDTAKEEEIKRLQLEEKKVSCYINLTCQLCDMAMF